MTALESLEQKLQQAENKLTDPKTKDLLAAKQAYNAIRDELAAFKETGVSLVPRQNEPYQFSYNCVEERKEVQGLNQYHPKVMRLELEELHEKISKSTGMEKLNFVTNWRNKAREYNNIHGEVWDVKKIF